MKFPKNVLHKIELASEEAIVNIIHHAYQERPEKIEIEIQCTRDSAHILFKDQGPPFNPLQQFAVDCESSLEQRKEGGLGIYLMRKYIPEMHYERRKSQNVLKFTIHSSQKR